MEVMTMLPQGRALLRTDLASVPDDGHRYELIDGALVVTPAPSLRHQTASMTLGNLLFIACPDELRVLAAPFDVALTPDTVLQPDLLVAPRDAFTDQYLQTAPLLAVEILSPSTRLIDLNLKKARYEAAGCPSYWVVDPIEPRLIAWELHDGRYVEVADVAGEATWAATAPYAVSVTPAELVR
jgi:Uma2 family endonuclease